MGFFLKRFFSLRYKQKATRPDSRPDFENGPSQPVSQPGNEDDNATIWQRGFDEHAAFRGSREVGGTGSNMDAEGDPDGDADAAVSRLLRSSSASYKVVEEANYAKLPPLPHPINTISSRSSSALPTAPSRTQSIQSRGSYRVTVHKRQQLSATIFPNAYPPNTPRRPGIAHTSTPNLLATYSGSNDATVNASTSTVALINPRKVPITPRDARRLSRLRQDPSVVSLVRLYDDHGRIAESAFTTTPAPPRGRFRKRRSRRKSTFSELLGCDGADFQWAESRVAQVGGPTSDNSISNASTSSLSSTDTPPLDSPATSTFNDADLDHDVPSPAPGLVRDSSTSTVIGLGKDPGISSLVVELSVATSALTVDCDNQPRPYLGPHETAQHETKGKEKALPPELNTGRERRSSVATVETQDRTMVSKLVRKPSQRASQIFNFIGERRERRKSQELLQGSTLLTSESGKPIMTSDDPVKAAAGKSPADKSEGVSRTTAPSPLVNLAVTSTQDPNHPKSAPPTRAEFGADPVPVPPPSIALHALSTGSRRRSHTCSQITGAPTFRDASAASAGLSSMNFSGSAAIAMHPMGSRGALFALQDEREWEKQSKRKTAHSRDRHILPAMSTPHPSKVARFKKVSFASRRRSRGRDSEHAALGEMTNAQVDGGGINSERSSFERRYDAFAANLDARTQQLQLQTEADEKENPFKIVTRRRGATIDLGLARAATITLTSATTTKHTQGDGNVPHTPTRSQSLQRFAPGQRSTSERAALFMADLHEAASQARV